MRHLFLVVCVATTIAPAPAQQTLVSPPGYASTEGNTNNFWPWNLYAPAPNIREQEIYDSTNFTTQGVNGPITISRLRYRADGSSGSWLGGTWPNVQIDMSTAVVDFLTPSLTYALNHGPDLTNVLTGTVIVQPGSGTAPGPWYVDILLTTPFVYDPSTGNDLVVDIRITGALVGNSHAVDHVSSAGPFPPRATRLLNSTSSSATAASGADLNYSAVIEFTYVAGASYSFFGAGCAGTAGIPSNQALTLPVLGQTMIASIGNMPAPELGIYVIGWSNTTWAIGALPFNLAAFGAPGCFLRVSNDWTVALLGSGGTAGFALAIPSSTSYVGLRFYTQAVVLDAAANAFGATTSDAATVVIGY